MGWVGKESPLVAVSRGKRAGGTPGLHRGAQDPYSGVGGFQTGKETCPLARDSDAAGRKAAPAEAGA